MKRKILVNTILIASLLLLGFIATPFYLMESGMTSTKADKQDTINDTEETVQDSLK